MFTKKDTQKNFNVLYLDEKLILIIILEIFHKVKDDTLIRSIVKRKHYLEREKES